MTTLNTFSIPTRKLDFDACYNARDLGHYETRDGQRTRWGAFVRTDDLSRLSPRGQASVLAHGVRTVIDLRRPYELDEMPNPFANASEVNYVHLSLIEAQDDDALNHLINTQGVLAWNLKLLALSRHNMVQAMQVIADAPAGGVLFHCYAGKDRTGLISMFVLSLAGVSPVTIAQDYEESNRHLQPVNEVYLQTFTDPQVKAQVQGNLLSGAENMLKIQAHLDEQYGGVARYLLEGGLSREAMDRVRSRIV